MREGAVIHRFAGASTLSIACVVLKFRVHLIQTDCSTTLNDVTSNKTSALRSKSAPLARLSAFVLLVLVAYGAIAGAAHNHGTRLPAQLRAGTHETVFDDSGGAETSSRRLTENGECLVCQLQNHLFSGLLNALPQIAPPVTPGAYAPHTVHFSFSETHAPRRGRAPPTSLS
jgi:hypothetical protein